jgi:MFS family permease
MHREREESYRSWPGQLAATVSARLNLRYERRVMLLLLLVLVVDYADRTLIGALGPTLQRVFHIGNSELGFLAATFSFVGAAATIPLGMLVDRLKRTWLLALSLVIWAAAMGATGAAVSFAMLFGARLLLGAVSATTGPTVPSLTGDLVRAGKRAKALGFIDSGQLIGTGIGFLLAALVTSFLSFRWCFWLLGIGGAGLAVASWRTREPARTCAAGPTRGPEQDEGEEGDGQKSRVQELVQEKGVEPNPRAVLTEESPHQMSIWDAALYVVRVRTDVVVLGWPTRAKRRRCARP